MTEHELIRLEIDRYLDTPEGQAEIARLAAEIADVDLDTELERLVDDGLLAEARRAR